MENKIQCDIYFGNIYFDGNNTIMFDLPKELFEKVHRIIVNGKSSKETAIFYELEEDVYDCEKEN